MKKPEDLYMNEEPLPRAGATYNHTPAGYGALGNPLDSSLPEPMISVDSPLMTIDEVEILIIWLVKARDWMEQELSSDLRVERFSKKIN